MSESKTDAGAPDWAAAAEARVLDAALPIAGEAGWGARTVQRAARAAGLSAADAQLLLPNGPRDLAALYSRRLDAEMLDSLAGLDPSSVKIRERIGRAILARLEAAAVHAAATRRWAGFMVLPTHAPLALRLQWESADAIWRWAGDKAVDENHYSKRAILSAILGPALMIRLTAGRSAAEAYVGRRIGEVMAFEKWKAGLPKRNLATQTAGALGKLRYARPMHQPDV
ncbi:MAG TPA: COQ9 family protein [Caulobacteraceae bacterium]|nr:COQ9 family protein [Caulobacteraceae bacterium]